ncbi:uncharacterized protein GGS22DRAFT_158588 [Annulohypoxylon maeteangense]|uniref:uncharacterized protein n=1 Tax=Annulohypoxylon maeteangense TaxID=1927788 RepID=UPI002008C758|nr:uncharacterized protein GGS22DRAFT_158588 [Annulohypoxylon maeteangense]KAI0886744.1 hypothetical protein GGS22DRAFT_158588 [Annulohypoxylon maeteangense]
MAESSPLNQTPKRKRDDVLNEQRTIDASPNPYGLSNTIFSFQPPILKPVDTSRNETFEDGNSSPRSKVAQQFRELALGSGGGVTHNEKTDGTVVMGNRSGTGTGAGTDEASLQSVVDSPRFSPELPIFDFDGGSRSSTSAEGMQLDDVDNLSRKRVKLPDQPNHSYFQDADAMGLNGEANTTDLSSLQRRSQSPTFTPQTVVDPSIMRLMRNEGSSRLRKSYPSINRLSDSKSRSRKRAGTPPLTKRKTTDASIEEEPVIVDPVRASLTWHEDEITVYDPEDKDDDGTGINGIGFKPTPAIAYARAQKRRQQLADYRKREESEARARRNQRRRQQLGNAAQLERQHSMSRVRFSDAEPSTVVTN